MGQKRRKSPKDQSQNGTEEQKEEHPASEEVLQQQKSEVVEIEAGELEELRRRAEELEETRNQAKRIMAEYLNYKSRAERNAAIAAQQARKSLLLAILPSLDDFIRALNALHSTDSPDDLKTGLELAVQKLLENLKKCGVEPIYPKGEKFDPRYHEAVLLEENDDVEPNTILDVVEPGWLYCEGEQKQVIKPAKVKVSKHSS